MAAREAPDPVKASTPGAPGSESGPKFLRIRINGVVQGVGLRPFIYRLATELALAGWVRNTSHDVTILIGGEPAAVRQFLTRIPVEAPPLARIHSITVEAAPHSDLAGFRILESVAEPGHRQFVSPDAATCPACLAEIMDEADRRYHYPFTNCTNCGPRFTIISDMPYDRPNTTMASFTMCPDCLAEYTSPANRRFHAQPNACPICGPSLSLRDSRGAELPCENPIEQTATLLNDGSIVAIKGLGGYLLACDATSARSVGELRLRKHRPSKPFAVMLRDIDTVCEHCHLSPEEEALLLSPAAPIVLLRKRRESTICPEAAPGLLFLGIMVPYTPLHHLLLRCAGRPLIMTSGNLSEEPIAADDGEAIERLHGIADYFLVHNRQVYSRYDDSVTMVVDGQTHVLRRARGYAPYPIELPRPVSPVLAVGPQSKNTFCLAEGRHAFVSQHIGDLDRVETLDHLENTIGLYRRLFQIEPSVIAHDLHPDYASTSLSRGLAASPDMLRPVQHHHAHIVSCMVENAIETPVIGIAFDGSGFGADGRVWGGEFLVCTAREFRRVGHLEYLPLPGGDAATLRPCRIAAAYTIRLLGEERLRQSPHVRDALTADEWQVLLHQVKSGFNTPLTSSMGRLFDAVAAISGVRQTIDYDGQAAIELEMRAHSAGADRKGAYAFDIDEGEGGLVVRAACLLDAIIRDVNAGLDTGFIAAAFHHAVVGMAVDMCRRIAEETGIDTVALSGGVFQNRLLLEALPPQLCNAGFRVLLHRYLPANDGCVSLGQAVIAGLSQ